MEYLIHLAIFCAIYAILGISLNLIMGYTGMISIAHAGFYGIGAYATAILSYNYGMNFFLSMLIGIITSMIAALLIGMVITRLRGDYFILASLGFNFIAFSIMLNWQGLTRGALGIPGIARPKLFGLSFMLDQNRTVNLDFLILSLVILGLIYVACRFIGSSSLGRVLKSIREDETAIQVFGYNTLNYKLLIFIIGAGMAAVAGSLFASYISYIDPSTFTVNESVFIIAIIILGGLANLKGSILGAIFLVLLPEALRFIGFPNEIAGQMRLGIYGLLLVILMLYRPQGLMGEYKL